MAAQPLVSVVMPAFNYGRYLRIACESVWAQTWRPLELVVVDDGSTDDTPEVLAALERTAPIPFRHFKGPHKGVAAALNLAMKQVRGELISILHADDYLKPEKIERQVRALEDDPRAVLAHCEYVAVDEHGQAFGYDSSVDLPPASGESLRNLLEMKVDVRSMTMLMRRSEIEAIGPYDESLPVEDWQAILRLARRGPIVHVPEQLVCRRVHGLNHGFSEHKKKTFSFSEIAENVLAEVTPPDMELDRVLVLHSTTVIRNSIALGNWAKAADGLKKVYERFPRQRSFLFAKTAPAVSSWLWVKHLRRRTPQPVLEGLLALKSRWRARQATGQR